MNGIRFLIISSFLLLSFPCCAQIRVIKAINEVSRINLSGFQTEKNVAANLFFKTFQSDLIRSGFFRKSDLANAEYRVTGFCKQVRSDIVVKCQVYGVISKRRLLSKTYRAPASDPRALAHRITDDIVYKLSGRPGIASTHIVMVSTRTGSKELYICDADGKSLMQLTHDKSISVAPKWASDGRQLVYTSYCSHFPDVYLITLKTGKRQCIASYPGLNACPALSPDGWKIALTLSKDGNPDLFIKDLASGQLTRLTSTKFAGEASPSWSPDGRQIVFVSDQSGSPQLYIISCNSRKLMRITGMGSENVEPDWGPDKHIVYASRIRGKYQIYVLNSETLAIHHISPEDADYTDPSWAPDGRHIACVRTEHHHSRIFIIDVTTKSCINLLPECEKGEWYSPDWSAK